MLTFSSKEKAACIWLIEKYIVKLNEQNNDNSSNHIKFIPLNEKLNYIKNFIRYDNESDQIKIGLTANKAKEIIVGDNYNSGMGQENKEFLNIVLLWICNANDIFYEFFPFAKKNIQTIDEIKIAETIYNITHNEYSSEEKNWKYYKEQYYYEMRFKANWDFDDILTPNSVDEAIGALAFLKSYCSDNDIKHPLMQELIQFCKNKYAKEPLIKRQLPIYEEILNDANSDKIENHRNLILVLSLFAICVLALIAIGIEVYLLHWWALLSGILTIAIPYIFYQFWQEIILFFND